jgi:hypothetical protein
MARTVATGRMYDHEVCPSVSGAANAAMTRSAAVASQTGRNRAATAAFVASRRAWAAAYRPVGGDDGGLAATTRHSHQVRRTVSMMA